MKKVEVRICVGTTCHLMGGSILVNEINKLPVEILEGISLKYATCFDVCQGEVTPPVVMINGKLFGDMNPEKLENLIKKEMKEVM